MKSYYNQTDKEFGVIDPKDELLPISVLEWNVENIVEYANLDVFVNSPYSAIKPIEVIATNIENH
jgi:hypothetical protein